MDDSKVRRSELPRVWPNPGSSGPIAGPGEFNYEQRSQAVAGALRRVTGLTLVDGRFIYVRGLGERYSSTLLNGANVPSPDPTRRVVPLDLFPTNIVKSIAVKKGYTADLPGEFGGGTVELRTKSVPEAPFFEIEAKIGYNDQTTGKSGLTYDGGSDDWTGSDDGTRAMSDLLMAATAGAVFLGGAKILDAIRYETEARKAEEAEGPASD